MPTLASRVQITAEQVRRYHDEGYFLLERVLSDEELQTLRQECQAGIDYMDSRMDREKTDVLGLNHRRKRYFISNFHKQRLALRQFLFSDLMADICRATIGNQAFLFVEQFVVKFGEVGMKFAWHQDSGYIGHDHKPYLSCWIALDDVNENNGTVYMLPYARAGTRTWVPHTKEEGTNDLIGYTGKDPGDPIVAPAGSIAVFSSFCFHRSGANTTPGMRRILLAQYSPQVIWTKDGSRPWANAVPLLRDGRKAQEVEGYVAQGPEAKTADSPNR